MKKVYIALAVIVTVMLSSCAEREMSFNDVVLGENELSFTLQGVSTKAGDMKPVAVKGITIPMGTDNSGNALFLEETIEELNPSPVTKGAPAYTVNVGKLYTTMGVYATQGNFGGDATFEVMDYYINKDSELGMGWRYNHNYSGRPWPTSDTEVVDFYFNMPAAPSGVTFTGRASKKINFSYQSPTTGEAQQDILFAQESYSKTQHDSYLENGAPVLMYHALTGVKFRNGHPNDHQTKTIITSVKFTGLKNSGTCTVDPSASNVVAWVPGSTTGDFTQGFDNPAYDEDSPVSSPDGTISTWSSDLTGTSWTSAAADKNLNDENGSLTFWFIPQEISNDVKLEVSFVIKTPDTPNGSGEYTHIIDFGELLNADRSSAVEWEAGQLRTYTLKPFDVDVEIEDEITEDTKSDLHIANTGNVDEYVRMLLVGNWYGWEKAEDYASFKQTGSPEPSILVGYTTDDVDDHTMVLPWYREGYPYKNNVYYATEAEAIKNGWVKGTDGYRDPYGAFDSTFTLAHLGDRDGKKDDWADASGGFYYTMPIGPGEGVASEDSATEDLFASYTVTNVPTIYIATNGIYRTEAVGVHLVMEVVVQAIAVPKNDDGTNKWWLQAWYDATGNSKLDPDAERNATYKTYYTNGEYNQE